jgi:prepilin-type N-terminal cleavage/methylation domain-containing protein
MGRSQKQDGFSLLELLVVMAIMLVITTATMSLMRDSMKVTNVTFELADAQENLRIAHEYINRDLLSSGEGLTGIGTFRINATFIGNYLTTNAASGFSMIASDNNVASGTNVIGTNPAVTVRRSPDPNFGTDRLTILSMDSSATYLPLSLAGTGSAVVMSNSNLNATVTLSATAYANATVGEIYCISSGNMMTLAAVTEKIGSNKVRFFTGDTLGLNDGSIGVVTNNGVNASSMMRMKVIHYFVSSDGLLVRRVFGVSGKAYNDDVIAEHVVDLQFNYITNEDTATGIQKQPTAQLTTGTQQVAVRQVDTTITTETVHPIVNGQRQQVSMLASTGIRNMQFRQAQQP